MTETGLRVLEMLGVFLSGGGFAFIGMLLKRKWEKKDKKDAVVDAISALGNKMTTVSDKVDEVRSSIMSEIEKDRAENQEYRARQCRARILQFNDEVYRKEKHTKESFDDVIAEIDTYENYCDTHPDFENFKAVAAIENIKETYKERLRLGDFLS